jgi:hypothetical protein
MVHFVAYLGCPKCGKPLAICEEYGHCDWMKARIITPYGAGKTVYGNLV